MKKKIFTCMAMLLCLACGCKNQDNSSRESVSTTTENLSTSVDTSIASDEDVELDDVQAYNKTLITDLLKLDEDDNCIYTIIDVFDTIDAGKIQSAEIGNEDGDRILKIVAENGTHFKLYLNNSNRVDAVYNENTKEWPVKSFK